MRVSMNSMVLAVLFIICSSDSTKADDRPCQWNGNIVVTISKPAVPQSTNTTLTEALVCRISYGESAGRAQQPCGKVVTAEYNSVETTSSTSSFACGDKSNTKVKNTISWINEYYPDREAASKLSYQYEDASFDGHFWILRSRLVLPEEKYVSQTCHDYTPPCPRDNGPLQHYQIPHQCDAPHTTQSQPLIGCDFSFSTGETKIGADQLKGVKDDVPAIDGRLLRVEWDLKRKPICGPEISKSIEKTLREIAAYFKTTLVSHEKKVEHCESLHSLNVGISYRAWDIDRLFYNKAFWLDSYTQTGRCCVPGDGITDENEDPKTCKHSVRYKKRCVLAGTLNYLTFGVMHRLCHDYFLEAQKLASRYRQLVCVMRLAGVPGGRPGGVVSEEDMISYNKTCRAESGYPEDVELPLEDSAVLIEPPEPPNPAGWDKASMDKFIFWYKTATTWSGEDISAPTVFAGAGFDWGAEEGKEAPPAPIENRAQCEGRCGDDEFDIFKDSFPWTWYPDHVP